jgi:hypothetical protein
LNIRFAGVIESGEVVKGRDSATAILADRALIIER